MAYFPLFVNLEDKPVLVVGGGAIAERRICALLEFGCKLVVVSPEVTEKLEELSRSGEIIWKKMCYCPECLKDGLSECDEEAWVFVLAAAAEPVNTNVVRECKKAGIPVNNASRKEDCDFYFPGLVKENDVVIGVTSGGSDHKLVAALSKKIRELVQKTWQV